MRLAASALAAFLAVTDAAAADVSSYSGLSEATFEAPTTRYAHGVLGDDVEYRALRITYFEQGATLTKMTRVFTLPVSSVFEDLAPRLLDVTGDGVPEVIVVETDVSRGASLAIYDAGGKLAATPYIGQRNRWLAPVGAADLDGDGRIEIAYVDRPHLARILRVWRYENGKLTEIASLPGLTNHRIGERDIAGGIRTCAGQPEMIVASADWLRLIAVTFDGSLSARDIGPHRNRASFTDAMSCN